MSLGWGGGHLASRPNSATSLWDPRLVLSLHRPQFPHSSKGSQYLTPIRTKLNRNTFSTLYKSRKHTHTPA